MGAGAGVPADLAGGPARSSGLTAILTDAVALAPMAAALPVSVVPALGGRWPVTFVILQVVVNVYFARAGLWRILLTGWAR